MAGKSITVKVEEDVRAGLRAMAARGRRIRPLLAAIGQLAINAVEGNFQAQGRPKRWPALKRPRPNGRTGPVLTWTSGLRHSIGSKILNDETIVIGTNKIFASVHNDGYDGRQQVRAHTRTVRQVFGHKLRTPVTANVPAFSRHMIIPQREFLLVPTEDQRRMDQLAADYILKGGKS